MKPKVILCDARKADDAFAAHAALLKAEARDQRLKRNPEWTIIRQDAFERFTLAFREAN